MNPTYFELFVIVFIFLGMVGLGMAGEYVASGLFAIALATLRGSA